MEYSIRVQSQRRLYQRGEITIEQLNERLADKRLTQEEYDYIISQ
jgi:hypothetical protein